MSNPTAQISNWRAQFPILNSLPQGKPLIYFDNAASTQKPQVVIDALVDFYQNQNANVHRGGHFLGANATNLFEQARARVGKFINAKPHEIVFTKGATEAINLVTQSYAQNFLSAGDNIILSAGEHHANIVPWQLVAQKIGAKIVVVELNKQGQIDIDDLRGKLNSRSKLLCVAHAYNTTGAINDIATIINLCHANNCKVLIDGAQAIAHLPVDVQSLACDFYVFSGHKIFAPTGIGVLYAKTELLKLMPAWQAGGEMIATVDFANTSFAEPPYKFEAGTPPIASAIALGVALDWLQNLPRQQIYNYELELAQSLYKKLASFENIRLIYPPEVIGTTSPRLPIATFNIANWHAADIAAMLDMQGIASRAGSHCAQPFYKINNLTGGVRLSLSFYNSFAELDFLQQTIANIILQNNTNRAPNCAANNIDCDYIKTTQTGGKIIAKLQNIKLSSARQRQLLLQGQTLANMPAKYKTDSNLIKDCQSKVWLYCSLQTDNKINIFADSEANIIRAILAIILDYWQGQSLGFILQHDFNNIFAELKIGQYLSPSRSNGVASIINNILSFAQHNSV